MSINGKAYIVGAYEHPTRKAEHQSVAQLHAEVAYGALQDAGLSKDDIDGYFCAGDAPGLGMLNMADYMGLNNLTHVDSTDTGGSSYQIHVAHAHRKVGVIDEDPVDSAAHDRRELVAPMAEAGHTHLGDEQLIEGQSDRGEIGGVLDLRDHAEGAPTGV